MFDQYQEALSVQVNRNYTQIIKEKFWQFSSCIYLDSVKLKMKQDIAKPVQTKAGSPHGGSH